MILPTDLPDSLLGSRRRAGRSPQPSNPRNSEIERFLRQHRNDLGD